MSDGPGDATGTAPGPGTDAGEAPDQGVGWDELDTLPLPELRELFVTLGKALRAHQLYDSNNPVYQRFVNSLAEAFQTVWGELDRLTVHVTEDTLTLGQAEVYRSSSRADSLAFLFFKDGIRELTFLPGVEDEELTKFLSVLQKAKRVRGEGDDLVTLLWEADLQYVRYHYMDLLADGVSLPEPGPGHSEEILQDVLREEGVEEEAAEEDEDADEAQPADAAEGPKQVSREDFNPTLYSLDAREMEKLRTEIQAEMDRDLRRDVLAALFDRLEEPGDRERQSEIIGVLRQLLPNFLSRGAVSAATGVLAELRRMETEADVFDERRRAEVKELLDEVSSPAAMDELVRALEDKSIEPSPEELGRFLSYLRHGALAPLLRAVEMTEVKDLQPVLREAVLGIGERYQDSILRLLDHEDPVVVAGAARLVGRLQVPDAGGHLAELMLHPAAAVRLAAVEAARDLRASTAASALAGILDDPDRDVRIAAVRALGQLRYGPATDHLADLLTSKELRNADLTEKIAFFESYGMVAGERGVSLLDKLLNGRGFLGRREPAEIRACAALGLGKIGGPRAHEALRKADGDDDPVVRSAVNRALRGEEEEA